VLSNEGRVDEAIPYLARSVLLKPANAHAKNSLGVLYGKARRFEAAIPHLRAAIRYFEQDPRTREQCTTARVNLGNMLLELGRREEAMGVLRQAAADDPDNLTARVMIGAAMGDAGWLDEGIEQLRAVLRINPEHPGARATLEAALALRARTRPADR